MKEITYTVKFDSNGDKRWYVDGKLHREDGPAVEWSNGSKFWYRNDKLHREDGPAVEWSNGSKEWFINDVKLTEKEFNERTKKPSCAGTFKKGNKKTREIPSYSVYYELLLRLDLDEIEGKKYKLVEIA